MRDDLGDQIRQRIIDRVDAKISDGIPPSGRRNSAMASRLLFAIFLIAAGTLLFLGNIGVLPVRDLWQYWPLAVIVVGIGKLVNSTNSGSKIVSILMIVFGTLFLLLTLGIVRINAHDDSLPLSLLLIALGLGALVKVLEPSVPGKSRVGFNQQSWFNSSDNLLKDTAIFAEIKRKIETSDFQGGAAHTVFGSVVLNLRRAQVSPLNKTVSIDANAVFGSVKIRVPENWRIDIQGAAVLGSYSDKTIPPVTPDSETPTLIITGYAVFGGVEIEN